MGRDEQGEKEGLGKGLLMGVMTMTYNRILYSGIIWFEVMSPPSMGCWLTRYPKAYTKPLSLIEWPSRPSKFPLCAASMSAAGKSTSSKGVGTMRGVSAASDPIYS